LHEKRLLDARMKATLRRLGCTTAALVLIGCAHSSPGAPGAACEGCTSIFAEGGRLAVAQFGAADASAVQRVADSYCEGHHLGSPTIAHQPDTSAYPRWALYSFQCGERAAGTAVAQDLPAAAQPASKPAAAAPVAAADDADRFGSMCASMSFQRATPEFDGCVSKLRAMSAAQAQQLREQRRQAIRMIEQGLSALSPQGGPAAPTTIRLPSGEVLTCTQAGGQVSCN
jgi:hypothetical protein